MSEQKPADNQSDPIPHTPWGHIMHGMWRSPLGLMGVTITTISIALMLIGLALDLFGLVSNPYVGIITYLVLPGGMVLGLAIIPLAAWLWRRKHRHVIVEKRLQIDLSNPRHQKGVLAFIFLTVINLAILAVVGYEGYHFTDSPYFCGVVCHKVMAPEYTAYQRSPHARVSCVDCHIGPGAEWFVQAKLSGLRQVAAVFRNSYSRPIPVPVHQLRPARDTCEQCHWPEKFHGKRVKEFYHFSDQNQKKPETTEIALHIGGRNPITSDFEGIHWHVSHNVEVRYLAVDEQRTQIARLKVKRPDGSQEEFVKPGLALPEGAPEEWRLMDCIDCHNRPTHVFNQPEERVDFGLRSKRINPEIPGIRTDSLTAMTRAYASRQEAEEQMVDYLLKLQADRSPEQMRKYERDIRTAGLYLLETYLGNVWPEMKVEWGTYRSHLGHQDADLGYGCFRCHDEEHITAAGRSVSQSCDLCHDAPF